MDYCGQFINNSLGRVSTKAFFFLCTAAALLPELKPAPLFPVCHYWPNWL